VSSATGAVEAVTLLANGAAAGIMLSTVIGVAPLFLALPYTRYVQTAQFLRPRFDPAMPALNGLTLVLDLVLASHLADGDARYGFAAAAVLQVAVIAVSITRNVPVNKLVMALDPEREPSDWPRIDPRRHWRDWNLVRTSLALLAFAVNVAIITS